MSKERVEYIDLFRGFGILMMVMGHVEFGGEFHHWIHGFHMPMFFFISGYLYNQSTNWKIFFSKKIRTLIVPYLVFGLTQYIVWHLYKGASIEPLKNLLWINTDGLAICGAIWFLTALFLCISIYEILNRISSRVWLHLFVIVGSLVGSMWTLILPTRAPWGIDAALAGLGLLHAGRVIRDNKITITPVTAIALFAVMNIALIISPDVNMRTGKYGFIPLFYINAIIFSFVCLEICRFISDKTSINAIMKPLMYMGRNSIVYVCLNQLMITISYTVIDKLGNILYLERIVVLTCSLVALYIASEIIVKTPLRIIIGKK